jgi:hypothetical protein
MKSTPQTLPKVGECIKYVESLGYTFHGLITIKAFDGRRICHNGYFFRINRPETRPPHNWDMTWTLGEMRHAVKNGC